MDNKERTDAAAAMINWCNSQEISMADAEKIMYKVIAKIITNRMKITRHSPPPDQEVFHQEILASQEALMHELISRIYAIHGRKP